MARDFAQIKAAIWRDPDFIARTMAAQHLYVFLLSQPEINACGMLPLRPGHWATCTADATVEGIEAALDELTEARFLVVDRATCDVLVRSFVPSITVHQPAMVKSAARLFGAIHSQPARDAILDELPEAWRAEWPTSFLSMSLKDIREAVPGGQTRRSPALQGATLTPTPPATQGDTPPATPTPSTGDTQGGMPRALRTENGERRTEKTLSSPVTERPQDPHRSSGEPEGAAVAEPTDARLWRTAKLLAAHDLEHHGANARNPDAWVASATKRRASEPALAELADANPGWDPDRLAREYLTGTRPSPLDGPARAAAALRARNAAPACELCDGTRWVLSDLAEVLGNSLAQECPRCAEGPCWICDGRGDQAADDACPTCWTDTTGEHHPPRRTAP